MSGLCFHNKPINMCVCAMNFCVSSVITTVCILPPTTPPHMSDKMCRGDEEVEGEGEGEEGEWGSEGLRRG